MVKKGIKYKFVGGKDFVGNVMYKNLLNKIFICEGVDFVPKDFEHPLTIRLTSIDKDSKHKKIKFKSSLDNFYKFFKEEKKSIIQEEFDI